MLVQTISQYLGSHKRLVVPQLGAFIVKAPGGEILFSELFKRDDGVLRGLLLSQGAPQEPVEQLSLFAPTKEDGVKCLTGQI